MKTLKNETEEVVTSHSFNHLPNSRLQPNEEGKDAPTASAKATNNNQRGKGRRDAVVGGERLRAAGGSTINISINSNVSSIRNSSIDISAIKELS